MVYLKLKGQRCKMFLADKLRKLREKRNLTRIQVVNDMYKEVDLLISHETLRKWEEGITQPKADQVFALAQFYDIDIINFYDERRE